MVRNPACGAPCAGFLLLVLLRAERIIDGEVCSQQAGVRRTQAAEALARRGEATSDQKAREAVKS